MDMQSGPQPGDVIPTCDALPLHATVEVVRVSQDGSPISTLARGEVASVSVGTSVDRYGRVALTQRTPIPETGKIVCHSVVMSPGEMGLGQNGPVQTRLVAPAPGAPRF
jgi:hypothetical protein